MIIRTSCGTVVHTGDWKLDPDPLVGEDYDDQRLREIAKEGGSGDGVDSTNALDPGRAGSEVDVREALERSWGA